MPRGRKKEQPAPQAADEPAMIQCARHGLIHPAEDHCFECEAEEITAAQDEQLTTPSAPEPVPEPELRKQPITEYTCIDCEFRGSPEEALEHTTATNHTTEGVEPEPIQTELFDEPEPIGRWIEMPLAEGFLNETRKRLAELYQRTLNVRDQKKTADAKFNSELNAIDEEMRTLAGVLRQPFEEKFVECIWHISNERQTRQLIRNDTGEMIEEKPLTAEDRAQELAAAEAANKPHCAACGHSAAHTPHCTDNGFDVPCDCGQFVEPVAQEAAHAG